MTETNKPTAYAWLVFILSACFLFYKYILQVSPAVMTNDLMSGFSLTATSLGFLVGFYFYSYMLLQIPSGMILDRYDPIKVTALVIFTCAAGAYIFSNTHSFYLACFARLLVGVGAAFGTTSYMKLASIWFPKSYFPILSGFFGAACMSGAACAQAPLAYIVSKTGWREAMALCAYVGFILSIAFYFLTRRTHPHSTHGQTTFSLKKVFTIFYNRSNLPLLIYGGLAYAPATVFGGLWGVPFLMTAHHVPKTLAAQSVSLLFVGFAIGSLVIGPIGKIFKQHVLIVFCGTVLACLSLTIVIYDTNLPWWAVNTGIFLFGFFSGVYLLCYVIARDMNSAALFGTVVGIFNIGDPLFGAISDPLLGKILDMNWHGTVAGGIRTYDLHAYHWAFSVLILFQVLALASLLFIQIRGEVVVDGHKEVKSFMH